MDRDKLIEMARQKGMQKSPLALFRNEDDVHQLVLADGFRFVVLAPDSKPLVAPISESGIYEIDASLLANGKWPVGIISVDCAHVKAFTKLSPKRVNFILAASLRAIAERVG